MKREEKHKLHWRKVSSQIHARNSHLIQYCYDFHLIIISKCLHVTTITDSLTHHRYTTKKIPLKNGDQGVCDGNVSSKWIKFQS